MTLINDNITTPDGLAIDWIHGLLFWTDTGLDKVRIMFFYIFESNNNTLFLDQCL